jgi:acyl-CoA thioesterase I
MSTIAKNTLVLLLLTLTALVCKANPNETEIVAFGTSFTYGKGVFPAEAFPSKLEALLRLEGLPVRIKNEGVNGDTTVDLMRRLPQAVPEGTQIVIFEYAKGNDLRGGMTLEETVKNSEEIISKLVSRGIQVLLVIRGTEAGQLKKLTQMFKQRDILKYGIMMMQIEQPESSLLSDRQHPTADAHQEIAASMVPRLKRLIQRVNAKAGT